MEGMRAGVDNVRIDVLLSPGFTKAAKKLIFHLAAEYAGASSIVLAGKTGGLNQEKEEFSRLCHEMLLDGLTCAKAEKDIRVDHLAQVAVTKFLVEETRSSYDRLIHLITEQIRENEKAEPDSGVFHLKKFLFDIQEKRASIILNTGKDILHCLAEMQNRKLVEMRTLNFGKEAVLDDALFKNPMLHVDDIYDDDFLIHVYDIILGRRIEDPDRYDALLVLMKSLLTDMGSFEKEELVDAFLADSTNIDILINDEVTAKKLKDAGREDGSEEKRLDLKEQRRNQKRLGRHFYRGMKKHGLIQRIIALYEMQPVYENYCPPLVPHLIIQYLISSRIRKNLEARLKRLKHFYGKPFSLAPLKKVRMRMRSLSRKTKKAHMHRYLKAFSAFHRDYRNLHKLKEQMERVHLITDEKMINLSRANSTLYAFLLENEKTKTETPIKNHVILKADVRGSTDITHFMMERGLNPASHFSLNFFDPITEMLSDYGASKVFVEGDAIILSIFEREERAEGWYSVARACGMAVNILFILQQYNHRNRKNRLPVIELGIGICFSPKKPAFLFDGEHRIMISQAINHADRMSGCSRRLKREWKNNNTPFNLYVFQTESRDEMAKTSDDLFLRYNVNAIELNPEGFHKLSEEIDLRVVKVPLSEVKGERCTIYTGKYPTVTGQYQRLVIRESPVPRVDPETLAITGHTSMKYYEISTNPRLYSIIRT